MCGELLDKAHAVRSLWSDCKRLSTIGNASKDVDFISRREAKGYRFTDVCVVSDKGIHSKSYSVSPAWRNDGVDMLDDVMENRQVTKNIFANSSPTGPAKGMLITDWSWFL